MVSERKADRERETDRDHLDRDMPGRTAHAEQNAGGHHDHPAQQLDRDVPFHPSAYRLAQRRGVQRGSMMIVSSEQIRHTGRRRQGQRGRAVVSAAGSNGHCRRSARTARVQTKRVGGAESVGSGDSPLFS